MRTVGKPIASSSGPTGISGRAVVGEIERCVAAVGPHGVAEIIDPEGKAERPREWQRAWERRARRRRPHAGARDRERPGDEEEEHHSGVGDHGLREIDRARKRPGEEPAGRGRAPNCCPGDRSPRPQCRLYCLDNWANATLHNRSRTPVSFAL